ncbi:glycosyltransferase [Gammaproteobacteria bacterium]|nr:glycosyltransferase [Gammaproteobacteria bacterium]
MSKSASFSICIPTFNRFSCLQYLVNQLIGFLENEKLNLEICISDNCSTDETWEYIQGVAQRHSQFKIYKQEYNIGGYGNGIFVTSMATSEWMIVIGDDDCFIGPGFCDLLQALPSFRDYDYILVNCVNSKGAAVIDLPQGNHSSTSMIPHLQQSISAYGFNALYVFRQNFALNMRSRDAKELSPWHNFGTFIYYLSLKKDFFYFATPTVIQDAHGEEILTWQPHDWLRLVIQQLVIFRSNAQNGDDKFIENSNDIVRNNLWSLSFLKTFYAALLYLPDSAKGVLAAQEYQGLKKMTGTLSLKLHSIAYKCLSSIPNSFHLLLLKLFTKKDINRYKFTGDISPRDGYSRVVNISDDETK